MHGPKQLGRPRRIRPRPPAAQVVSTREKGSATLQTVIAVPAVLLAITMVFQAMEYYWAHQAAETAARQAVEAARVVGAGDGDGTARANSVLSQLGSPLEGTSINVVTQAGTVVATITGHPQDLVPGMEMDISVSAEGPVEQFSPPP